MPTYEYRCSNGHEFEQFQRMSEEPLRTCTVCGAPAERLLSSGAGLLFKGSGFYITDYRSDSYRKAAEADSGGAGGKAAAGGDKPKDAGSKGGTDTGSGSTTPKSTTPKAGE
jgi:putative FmdB family regulatory protein